MKINQTLSFKPSVNNREIKKQENIPQDIVISGTALETPDFIKHGKLLSQMSEKTENSNKGKILGAMAGVAIGGGMAEILTIPLNLGVAGKLITLCSAIAGGAIGAMVGKEGIAGNMDDDASSRGMAITVAITTNNMGLL